MIATSYYRQPYAFLPVIPSPLSPRSANIYGSRRRADATAFNSMESSSYSDENTTITKSGNVAKESTASNVPFSQRKVKTAPTPRAEDLRAQRRGAYLRRVREGRDDRRYEARGDDMMRLDFVQRQRAWEAEQARAAAVFDIDHEDDTLDAGGSATELPGFGLSQMHISSQVAPLPEEEVEHFLRDEDQELEALLEFMPEEPDEVQDSDGLWSDDVDYDELFSHVLSQQDGTPSSTLEMDTQMDAGEEMDVT